ncbi:short-chain dehydrogenase [Pseudomonas sp. S04]|uniref:SDR family oxidoreductase n=1 Tax=unclassified Pseudomonas TaxID=196821 RepID=UPI00131F92FF|nr:MULTISPECIES: SDR family oxidoreductase [unclassified Pseudomonas]QHC99694.1 short-chain dehydrogenase [Pseudomonas sp. S04]QHF32178.1 short-chain dehydrogenase [Pseudomonas sp. S19]
MPIALITGCSSGIGRALADVFKQAGYQVWATARKAEDVTTLAAAGFTAVQLDVNDGPALEQLSEQINQQHGGLDVLINNAGYGAMGPLLDGGVPAMQRQFETNVFALVGVTRALFPLLRHNKGLVVNIGSVSGVLVTPFAGAYCASKAAVHALSDALRMELAPFGIRVLEVQPGAIASSFAKNAGAEAEQLLNQQSPWWPLREGIRARAKASQDKPTAASEFAADLLKAVQQDRPPRLLRLGNGSRALPLLAGLLPKGLLESVLMKRFGLRGQL